MRPSLSNSPPNVELVHDSQSDERAIKFWRWLVEEAGKAKAAKVQEKDDEAA